MKRFFVAVAVALAALALAAPASATAVEITVTCTEATFSYSRFPTNIESSAVQTVTINGQPGPSSTITFTGPTFTSTLPLSISGNASVTATSAWTAHRSGTDDATANVQCGETTTTTGGTTGGTTTGGTTTGGDTTGGETTGGGTTGTGGVSVATTGGTEPPGGELPFTGLPIWVPILLAGALLAAGGFLLRRKRDELS
jgi:hypothetical protein